MTVPVTSLYAALLLFVALRLIGWVIDARRQDKVPLGDGGSKEVLLRMRAQSNFIETVPLALIGLLLMELNGMPVWFLHAYGIVLFLARCAHPIGMTNRYPQYPFRFGGTVATVTLLIVAGAVLFVQALLNIFAS